jgi:hypothetical protein
MRVPLFVVCVFAAVESAAAQPVARPTVTSPLPSPADPRAPQLRPRPAAPLSREEAETLRQRLKESQARQRAQAPPARALREAGLSDETDAVESATAAARTGAAGPIGIGLAPAQPPGPGKTAVDPGLAAVTRQKLRARLDREPTTAEIETELRVFDARVEQANRWLAGNRARIAKTYAATGAMPPAFDDEALRGAPTGRRIESAQVREAFRSLFRSLLGAPEAGVPSTPPAPPGDPGVPRVPAPRPSVPPAPRGPGAVVRDPAR